MEYRPNRIGPINPTAPNNPRPRINNFLLFSLADSPIVPTVS
jgi:hypothetical protein